MIFFEFLWQALLLILVVVCILLPSGVLWLLFPKVADYLIHVQCRFAWTRRRRHQSGWTIVSRDSDGKIDKLCTGFNLLASAITAYIEVVLVILTLTVTLKVVRSFEYAAVKMSDIIIAISTHPNPLLELALFIAITMTGSFVLFAVWLTAIHVFPRKKKEESQS